MWSAFANPHKFLKFSAVAAPLFYGAGALCILWGLWQGLWIVPKDEYQGGDIMRVMFIHVPAAWLAMASYSGLAVASFVWFIWRHELPILPPRRLLRLARCGRRCAWLPGRSGASQPGAPGGNGMTRG